MMKHDIQPGQVWVHKTLGDTFHVQVVERGFVKGRIFMPDGRLCAIPFEKHRSNFIAAYRRQS